MDHQRGSGIGCLFFFLEASEMDLFIQQMDHYVVLTTSVLHHGSFFASAIAMWQ
jgi:hypothetical protein